MPAEIKKEIELEIGHVLFIDIVGYSKLLIDEQRDYLHTLNEVVRRTDSFRAADAAGKLTRLPTGDGMALVFATTPDAPVSCAIEISNALRSHPELRVRMGIHSGPVSGTTDVNDRSNVAGAGINLAQRVMDCGDAGHILLSKHVADDLEQYRQWRSHLHDLGECEVKHDVRVHVVNLYTDELGNRELPEKFQQAKATLTAPPTSAPVAKPAPRSRGLIAALIIVAALAGAGGFYIFSHRPISAPTPAAVVIPEKSIAVLPFENLSERQSKRLLCRRHPGRNSHSPGKDCRSEGDLAHIDAALQERAGKPARDRKTTGRSPHPGRKRAEERRLRAGERAANQSSQ